MKKLLLLAVVAASFAGIMQSCKPNSPDGGNGGASLTVTNKQRSFVVYHTATWCGPCGLYAMPEFKKLVTNANPDNIVAVDYHSSNSSKLVPLWMKPNNDTLLSPPTIACMNRRLCGNALYQTRTGCAKILRRRLVEDMIVCNAHPFQKCALQIHLQCALLLKNDSLLSPPTIAGTNRTLCSYALY